ncbi:MAG: putative membrane protein YfcA [Candidatus Paceibacteria bacterium]|jgi:uncharacterized membrane protein YfcA
MGSSELSTDKAEASAEEEGATEIEFLSVEPRAQGIGVVLIGFVIAAWGAMCGIGGGLFAVPVMHYLYGLKLKEAIVASLALVGATTVSGTLAEVFRADSAIEWRIVLALIVGCLVGIQLGFRASKVLPARKLKLIFTVLLLFVGLRLLGLTPQIMHASNGERILPVITGMDVAMAAVIGFCGGFLSPLLGIGGGLVAVPALMFGIPDLGHLGARACSMAMGTVTSTRSMLLYYRAGELDLRRSMNLALGAALGAIVGVQLVHIPGVSEVAEMMLAATLLVVAVRFGLDVVKGSGSSAKS